MRCGQPYQVYTLQNDTVKKNNYRNLLDLYLLTVISSRVTTITKIVRIDAAVRYISNLGIADRDGGDDGGGWGGNEERSSDVDREVSTGGDDEVFDDAGDTEGGVSGCGVSGGGVSGTTATSEGGNMVVNVPTSLQSP